jgi:hypothetical protein
MDFCFLQASTEDYKCPNKILDRIVHSTTNIALISSLLIASPVGCGPSLRPQRNPPLAILRAFMKKFGLAKGVIRTDQGGKLARSSGFRLMMAENFTYSVKPTGANSASQNSEAEIFNNTLAVKVRTLLYGSGLPAKFWSAALLHAVYLHNCLVHSMTGITPYEGWYGHKPDVTYLKTVGSHVCVKCTRS